MGFFCASEGFCLCLSLCVAEYEDASLSSWVNKERFQGYLQIDGFTLYELGETGAVCIKTFIENMVFTLTLYMIAFQCVVLYFFSPQAWLFTPNKC